MTKALSVDITSLGLAGPGLPDWQASLPILRGAEAYQPEVMGKPSVKHLPASDRRRYTFAIALAITTAMKAAPLESDDEIPAVFACSGGDTDVINKLCSALTLPDCPVSPQQFVNSVHNAPAGYWSIAERNRAPTTSLSAYDASFGAGLLEAAVQVHAGRKHVLLIAYDVPAPMPIWPFRPLSAPFAVAMMVSKPDPDHASLARIDLGLGHDLDETKLDRPDLESLRLGNPAARSLPLLEAIARGKPADVVLAYLPPHHLSARVTPCL